MDDSCFSSNFEDHYNGFEGKSDNFSPREKLFLLIENELDKDFDRFSNRARFSTEALYELYISICQLNGGEPDFLFNGRDVISKEEFENLKKDDNVDNNDLENLWKELGD